MTAALTCCGGVYAHRATCMNHRHTFDGPPDCGTCRAMAEDRRANRHVTADVEGLYASHDRSMCHPGQPDCQRELAARGELVACAICGRYARADEVETLMRTTCPQAFTHGRHRFEPVSPEALALAPGEAVEMYGS